MIEQQEAITTRQPLLDQIRRRGYWRVVIRPGDFERERIPRASLFSLLAERAARFAVWPFPQVHLGGGGYRSEDDWIEQQSAWDRSLEYWRFYQSGQFIDYAGMTEDWRDRSEISPPDPVWQPGRELSLFSTVRHLAEIYEFAARLVLAREYNAGGTMHVEVMLQGLTDRRLIFDFPQRPSKPVGSCATADQFHHAVDIISIDLIARPQELALQATQQLLALFAWDLHVNVLRGIQESVVR